MRRRVANRLQHFGQRHVRVLQCRLVLSARQFSPFGLTTIGIPDRIDARAGRMQSADQRRAGRSAIWTVAVGIGETNSTFRQSVNVRRFVVVAAVAKAGSRRAHVGPPKVIDQQHHDVGLLRARR